jgi:hypothetical protein
MVEKGVPRRRRHRGLSVDGKCTVKKLALMSEGKLKMILSMASKDSLPPSMQS